jgi:hypothetical protein
LGKINNMKPKLAYLPLEPYKARYSELLSSPQGWAQKSFAKEFAVERIEADEAPATVIQSGSVLDSVNRPLWALGQVQALLKNYPNGRIYADDFFHPGLCALPYTGRDYSVSAFCWAQSFDRFDFTRPMISWMRPYEAMMMAIYKRVFVASPLLFDFITTVFPDAESQVKVVGLPFNSEDVTGRFDPSFSAGPYDVVYSSRFDTEKRPNFFLDVVELNSHLRFAVCTGHEMLKGNDYAAVARARHLADQGKLTIHANLSKGEYYSVLKASKVQFNCSLQDWVSFTLLEALAYKCIPCYPALRDFPVVFQNTPQFTYSPYSVEDASALIQLLLKTGVSQDERRELNKIVAYHDGTLDRIASELLAAD